MGEFPPTTVILPTTEWTTACAEVAEQLGRADELLLVCDDDSDSIADRVDDLPSGVRLVFAGDPEGCSGKANAIAAGMRAADRDRIVWTDDDFHHPPDWLARLRAGYEENGPVTEVPFFVGRDPLSTLLEPIYALGGTLGVYAGGIVWGGAVMFDRADLDEAAFLRDLRRSVSDDGTLTEHLDVTPLRRTRLVPVGGTVRESAERHVRFTQIVRRHDPAGFAFMSIVAALSAAGALLFPLPAMALLTLLQLGIYGAFGIRRWTFLLAYPATLAQVPLTVYAVARRTFVWGGRRYRWRGKFDVEVVESG
ncbi:glycosyltransferase [Haladaptatus salinisoli]|uniref:glycosyltransferase n=1 Tax=Haladaptatus salinisoli TaxID=2884876 RepID=UPI001D09D699|nr:glycosyltransferase [Haladaptatus salinisoli]